MSFSHRFQGTAGITSSSLPTTPSGTSTVSPLQLTREGTPDSLACSEELGSDVSSDEEMEDKRAEKENVRKVPEISSQPPTRIWAQERNGTVREVPLTEESRSGNQSYRAHDSVLASARVRTNASRLHD